MRYEGEDLARCGEERMVGGGESEIASVGLVCQKVVSSCRTLWQMRLGKQADKYTSTTDDGRRQGTAWLQMMLCERRQNSPGWPES